MVWDMKSSGRGKGRRRVAVLAASVVLALVGASCGGDDGNDASGSDDTTSTTSVEPVAGGSATFLLLSEVGSLDPVRMTGTAGSEGQRGFALYGALVSYDPQTSQAEPVLAESFESDASFTKWTLTIKPGITFSDGSVFDAEAVRINWARAKEPANRSPSLATLRPVTEMVVTAPLTLTVTLAQPNAHFDKAITRVGANYIASAQALSTGTDLTSQAVGAGPFVLRQWLRDDRMIMAKNPNWKGSDGGYLDELVFRVVGDEVQRVDTFSTGQADGFYTATPESVVRARSAIDGATHESVSVTAGQTYVFNMSKPPFDDIRVREAFVRGIDWQALADTVYGEGAEALTNFTLEESPWYHPDAALPSYDATAAQDLIDEYLADTGGSTLQIKLLAFQQSLDQARARFVQTSLSQLDNVEVEIEVNDSPTNIQKVFAGEFMTSSWGFPMIDPEPGLALSAYTGSTSNYSKFSDTEVDAWLDEARSTNDDDVRKGLYDQVFERLAEQLPYYPYVNTVNGFVVSPDLRGATVHADGVMRWDLVWKAE